MSDVKNIKIVINLGDKEFTLTTEQAKELREILDNLLGPRYSYYPYYVYPQVWYGGCWEVKNNTVSDGQSTYTITSKSS